MYLKVNGPSDVPKACLLDDKAMTALSGSQWHQQGPESILQ
jgi:hypothetical protein